MRQLSVLGIKLMAGSRRFKLLIASFVERWKARQLLLLQAWRLLHLLGRAQLSWAESDTTQALVVCKKTLVSTWCSLTVLSLGKKIGALERIRTSDRLVRSQVLYPAELRARQGREY